MESEQRVTNGSEEGEHAEGTACRFVPMGSFAIPAAKLIAAFVTALLAVTVYFNTKVTTLDHTKVSKEEMHQTEDRILRAVSEVKGDVKELIRLHLEPGGKPDKVHLR